MTRRFGLICRSLVAFASIATLIAAPGAGSAHEGHAEDSMYLCMGCNFVTSPEPAPPPECPVCHEEDIFVPIEPAPENEP